MSARYDEAQLAEAGRKIFAGEADFIWAASTLETLPPMQGMEIAFAGRSNVGKSSAINPHIPHARPHARADLFQYRQLAAARGHARLRLCQG